MSFIVFFLVIRNSSKKRRTGAAALIRGRRLLNFCPRCGAYSRAALIRVNTVTLPFLLQFNRLPLQDVFLGQCDLSVDPDRLTEPGHLHVGHVIATLSYSGDQDNYTDPNTGERIEKIIKNTYTSFYFYVLGLYEKQS